MKKSDCLGLCLLSALVGIMAGTLIESRRTEAKIQAQIEPIASYLVEMLKAHGLKAGMLTNPAPNYVTSRGDIKMMKDLPPPTEIIIR